MLPVLLPKSLEETILIRTIFEFQATFALCDKKKELMVHSLLCTNTELYPICFWGVLKLLKDRIFTKGHYFRQHYSCGCCCFYYY